MNTEFNYLYRDASNYKKWGAIIFSGPPVPELEERLRKALHDGEWFIASQVRVPEVFLWKPGMRMTFTLNNDDHCWHEFGSLEQTVASPNDEHQRTLAAFVEEMEAAAKSGWQEFNVQDRK